MDYSKSTQDKQAFREQVFKLFTDECGGDPQDFADALWGKYTVDDFTYHDDMYYWGVIGYFQKVVIPHKIAVHKAGIELMKMEKIHHNLRDEEWKQFRRNLWLHDLSKFSANEAFGYAMYNRETGHGKEGFELAWHHHKMNNPHHPEYWLNPNRSGELEPLYMPNIYILEMIADWIGAGKTYGSSLEEWLPKNLPKFKFKNYSKILDILRDVTGLHVVIDEGSRLFIE